MVWPTACWTAGGTSTPTAGEAAFTPREAEGEAALHHRIAELERFCGQLALENAALKKGLSSMASRSGTP